MSKYIEKDVEGDYFNPTSNTVKIDSQCCPPILTNSGENILRWSWLIDKWEEMTFRERMSIFLPKTHYVTLKDCHHPDFDDKLNEEIVNNAYLFCRDFWMLQFDPDRQGSPNILIIYKPIDVYSIPNDDIKAKVISWGTRFRMLSLKEPCCQDCC